jgi:hypothetical protein
MRATQKRSANIWSRPWALVDDAMAKALQKRAS